jgi:hypothetical protein
MEEQKKGKWKKIIINRKSLGFKSAKSVMIFIDKDHFFWHPLKCIRDEGEKSCSLSANEEWKYKIYLKQVGGEAPLVEELGASEAFKRLEKYENEKNKNIESHLEVKKSFKSTSFEDDDIPF